LANIRKELVLSYIQKYHPATIQDLKTLLDKEGIRSTDQGLMKAVQELEDDGIIGLHYLRNKNSFVSFIGDFYSSWWIYFAIVASIAEVILVAYQPSALVFQASRMVLGLLLLGVLPGYVTVQSVFPGKELRELEQLLLTIFLSVAISIAIGVALGFAYVFTALNSAILSASYSVAVSLMAGYRRYARLVSDATGEAKR
jgi:Protein of unknown function (DUF1616)